MKKIIIKIPDNYKEYIKESAWLNRTTMTGYILNLIKKDMLRNIENPRE